MNTEKLKKLNCLANDLERVYHKAALKLKVTDSILCILYIIYEKGNGCLLYDICTESGISKQTINSAVRKLEKENAIFLKQDKGKTKRVFLTEKGEDLVNNTAKVLFSAECNAFSNWTEQELEQYIALTKKHINTLSNEIEKLGGF